MAKAGFFLSEPIKDSVLSLFIKIQLSEIVIDVELLGEHVFYYNSTFLCNMPVERVTW